MHNTKNRKKGLYSFSITNGPSASRELAGTLLPGPGVNMGIMQSKGLRIGNQSCKGSQKRQSDWLDNLHSDDCCHSIQY